MNNNDDDIVLIDSSSETLSKSTDYFSENDSDENSEFTDSLFGTPLEISCQLTDVSDESDLDENNSNEVSSGNTTKLPEDKPLGIQAIERETITKNNETTADTKTVELREQENGDTSNNSSECESEIKNQQNCNNKENDVDIKEEKQDTNIIEYDPELYKTVQNESDNMEILKKKISDLMKQLELTITQNNITETTMQLELPIIDTLTPNGTTERYSDFKISGKKITSTPLTHEEKNENSNEELISSIDESNKTSVPRKTTNNCSEEYENIERISKNTPMSIDTHINRLLADVQALDEMIEVTEQDWNNMLHLRTMKGEVICRLKRKREIEESEVKNLDELSDSLSNLAAFNKKTILHKELLKKKKLETQSKIPNLTNHIPLPQTGVTDTDTASSIITAAVNVLNKATTLAASTNNKRFKNNWGPSTSATLYDHHQHFNLSQNFSHKKIKDRLNISKNDSANTKYYMNIDQKSDDRVNRSVIDKGGVNASGFEEIHEPSNP